MFLEKASQSFAAAAAKGFGIVFGAALPTPKTHLRPQVCPKGARSGLQSPRPEKAGRPFLARKNAPDFFKSGAWNVAHAVPPWFSRRSPERPSKPPTRPWPLTRPTVPPYFSVQADCSGTSYPQGGRTPVCTNHRFSEGGRALSFFPSLHLMFYILTKERRFVKWIFPRGRESGAHPSGDRAWTPPGAGRRGGWPPEAGNRCSSSPRWWSRPGSGN